MCIFNLESFITLYLIKKIKSFRDSYSLNKVLAWKFNIITILEITNQLEKEKLIKKIPEVGNEKYEVTDQGLEYINTNIIEGKALLLEKYEKERDFINLLFGSNT